MERAKQDRHTRALQHQLLAAKETMTTLRVEWGPGGSNQRSRVWNQPVRSADALRGGAHR